VFRQIIRPDTKIDFLGKARIAIIASLLIIAAGLLSALVQGVQWGIDFAGGTEVQVHFPAGSGADEEAVRQVVESVGVAEPTVVRFSESGREEFQIRFAGRVDDAGAAGAEGAAVEGGEKQGQIVDRIRTALTEKIGPVEVDRVEFVGPKVGEELRRDGTRAMLISWLLILAYVGLRFNLQFAPGGVVALVHDVLVTAAIWQLLGQSFDLQVLAALLAIISYSINDTIVIFDRIREMIATHTTHDITEVTNKAVNLTLSRTILTSLLTLLAVVALLLFAGPVIFPFSAVMGIGIFVGCYSTIYIASPVMLAMERWRARRSGKPSKAGAAKRTRAARA
jgi:preprotein translocase subunit SecF